MLPEIDTTAPMHEMPCLCMRAGGGIALINKDMPCLCVRTGGGHVSIINCTQSSEGPGASIAVNTLALAPTFSSSAAAVYSGRSASRRRRWSSHSPLLSNNERYMTYLVPPDICVL